MTDESESDYASRANSEYLNMMPLRSLYPRRSTTVIPVMDSGVFRSEDTREAEQCSKQGGNYNSSYTPRSVDGVYLLLVTLFFSCSVHFTL